MLTAKCTMIPRRVILSFLVAGAVAVGILGCGGVQYPEVQPTKEAAKTKPAVNNIETTRGSTQWQSEPAHVDSSGGRVLSARIARWDAKPNVIGQHFGHSFAWSRDGAWLYTCDISNHLEVWRVKDETRIAVADDDRIYKQMVASSNGDCLVGISVDGALEVRDSQNLAVLRTVKLEGDPVGIDIAPKHDTIAVGFDNGAIILFDLNNLEKVGELAKPYGNAKIMELRFSPQGDHLATLAQGEDIRLWDIASKRLRKKLGPSGYGVGLAFYPDGKRLVAPGEDVFAVWNLETGEIESTIGRLPLGIDNPVAVSPDGKLVASFRHGGLLEVFNGETGELCSTLQGHSASDELAFSPDGAWLATGSLSFVRLWNTTLLRNKQNAYSIVADEKATYFEHEDFISAVAFSPDGRLLCSVDWAGHIIQRNLPDGTVTLQHQVPADVFASVTYSNDSSRLFAMGNGEIHVLSVNDGKQQLRRVRCDDLKANYSIKNDGNHVSLLPGANRVIGTNGERVLACSLDTGKVEREFTGHSTKIQSIACAPSGEYVAAIDDKTLKVWKTASGDEMAAVNPILKKYKLVNVQFSADSLRLAVSAPGLLQIYSVPDLKVIQDLSKHIEGCPFCMAFSPNDRVLAAGDSGVLVAFDTQSGELVARLVGAQSIQAITFSPDGITVATGGMETTVKLWSLDEVVEH